MTTEQICIELRRLAAALAPNAPAWALDEAAREVASIVATARIGSAIDGDLGEIQPAALSEQARLVASKASDYLNWWRYRLRARAR